MSNDHACQGWDQLAKGCKSSVHLSCNTLIDNSLFKRLPQTFVANLHARKPIDALHKETGDNFKVLKVFKHIEAGCCDPDGTQLNEGGLGNGDVNAVQSVTGLK